MFVHFGLACAVAAAAAIAIPLKYIYSIFIYEDDC